MDGSDSTVLSWGCGQPPSLSVAEMAYAAFAAAPRPVPLKLRKTVSPMSPKRQAWVAANKDSTDKLRSG